MYGIWHHANCKKPNAKKNEKYHVQYLSTCKLQNKNAQEKEKYHVQYLSTCKLQKKVQKKMKVPYVVPANMQIAKKNAKKK